MNLLLTVTHGVLVLSLPIVLVGLVNRTKSWWAGRKGPRLLQSAHDLLRLLGKRPIISHVASPLFRMSAYVVLVCALAAASMVPMLGQFAPVQFSHDFIVVAYTLGLARIALTLAAMDVGSAFEGMGAAREASFSALATSREPAAQLVGLLFMENALALFESLMPEPWALPVHLAVSGVYILTVAVGSWLVRGHLPDPSAASALKENA